MPSKASSSGSSKARPKSKTLKKEAASEKTKIRLEKNLRCEREKKTKSESNKVPKKNSALSMYDPKRRNRKFALLDRIRELIPEEKMTNEELEDQEVELRHIKSEETITFSVYKPPRSASQSSKSSLFEPQELATELPARDNGGYSPQTHIRQLVNDLQTSPHVQKSQVRLLAPADPMSDGNYPPGKKEFDPALLGHDEDEFQATKFKAIVKGYIPEEFHHQIKSPPGKNSHAQHHQLHKKRCVGRWCCAWVSLSSCGTCYCVKMYIVATILCSILMHLTDPCYLDIDTSAKVQNGTNSSAPLKTISPNMSEPMLGFMRHSNILLDGGPKRSRPHRILILMSKQANYEGGPWTLDRKENRPGNKKAFSDLMLRDTLTTNQSANWSTSVITVDHSREKYCPFKTYYLVWMCVGVLCYLAIFITYTCQLIVHYYDLPWFLFEAALCSLYCTVLLFNSVIAYIFITSGPLAILENTILLLDSVLGLLLAYWNYANHTAGVTPLLIITTPDPDMNEIAQILGKKQFYKWFAFGKENGDEKSSK